MKTKILQSSALIMSIYSAGALAAQENTISFQGEVSDQTCSVTINGQATPVVLLPTVSTSALSTPGSTSGKTPFEVSVSGCEAATSTSTNINAVFAGTLVDTANKGTLRNTGTAENVNLQLVSSAGNDIDLSNTFTSTDNELSLSEGESEKTATYWIQYYTPGAATAGTVAASLQYTVSYL